jgi:hypothetical protein
MSVVSIQQAQGHPMLPQRLATVVVMACRILCLPYQLIRHKVTINIHQMAHRTLSVWALNSKAQAHHLMMLMGKRLVRLAA